MIGHLLRWRAGRRMRSIARRGERWTRRPSTRPWRDPLWAYLARARDAHLGRGAVARVDLDVAWPGALDVGPDLGRAAERLACTDVRVLCCTPLRTLALIDEVERRTGRPIRDTWRSWRGLVHAGVSFGPFADAIRKRAGHALVCVETLPAACAVQDREGDETLVIAVDHCVDPVFVAGSKRYGLHEVEIGMAYRLFTAGRDSGEWVRFTSARPPRLVRVERRLNLAGERVEPDDLAASLSVASRQTRCEVRAYAVFPEHPDATGRKGRHVWIVECVRPPEDLGAMTRALDGALRERSSTYAALRAGDMLLAPPVLRLVRRGTFEQRSVPAPILDRTQARALLPG